MAHLVPVAFHGATIFAVLVNGDPHVSIRSICEALGLQREAQYKRIQRHPVLQSTVSVTDMVAADGKQREPVTLPRNKLNGWLFGVSAARVRPELRERLVQYQRECFDVLAAHFGARPAGAGAGTGDGTPGAAYAGAPRALPAALHAVQQATLGHALAHRHHDELARLQLTAEALGLGAQRLSRTLAQEMNA